jgi:hypothetical protein
MTAGQLAGRRTWQRCGKGIAKRQGRMRFSSIAPQAEPIVLPLGTPTPYRGTATPNPWRKSILANYAAMRFPEVSRQLDLDPTGLPCAFEPVDYLPFLFCVFAHTCKIVPRFT